MNLQNHYAALIKKEYGKLEKLSTRPWAISMWLLSGDHVQAEKRFNRASVVLGVCLHAVLWALLLKFGVVEIADNSEWWGLGLGVVICTVLVGAMFSFLSSPVWSHIQAHGMTPASWEAVEKLSDFAQKIPRLKEALVRTLEREGTSQFTQLQASALLFHFERISGWMSLEETRREGLEQLDRKTGAVTEANRLLRAGVLENQLPEAATALDRPARF